MFFYFSARSSPWWDVWKDSSDDMFDSLRYFASQIDCLRIDENLPFNVLNQINILDYSNVRILKLCKLDTIQCDAIRPENFPRLKHLSLEQTENFSLEVLCQFKSLHSCEIQSLNLTSEYSNLSSCIRSMFLRRCHPSDMPCLLHCFPQMTFLKICITLSTNDFETWKPTVNLVHSNMKSFDVYFLDYYFSPEETTVNKCDYVSQFLKWITFDPCIRYRLSLVNTRNFNFQQLPHILHQLRFTRLLLRFVWLSKYVSLPNIDCIRQIPLFNQLQMLNSDSLGALYHIIWNNTLLSNS